MHTQNQDTMGRSGPYYTSRLVHPVCANTLQLRRHPETHSNPEHSLCNGLAQANPTQKPWGEFKRAPNTPQKYPTELTTLDSINSIKVVP